MEHRFPTRNYGQDDCAIHYSQISHQYFLLTSWAIDHGVIKFASEVSARCTIVCKGLSVVHHPASFIFLSLLVLFANLQYLLQYHLFRLQDPNFVIIIEMATGLVEDAIPPGSLVISMLLEFLGCRTLWPEHCRKVHGYLDFLYLSN